MEFLFWLAFLLIIYTYFGYALLLFILKNFSPQKRANITVPDNNTSFPEVTFVVAAYNEEDFIEQKILNSLQFDYPQNKLHLLFVTDGSTDSTLDKIKGYTYPPGTNVSWHHEAARRGKIAAVERIMAFVKTPIVIYSDANTDVNPTAIKNIVRHYQDPKTGGVAGEKRIFMKEKEAATASGEGLYWKYESALKKWDAELYSVVGAAGELFSVRTALYHPIPKDSIIEDFIVSININQQGYRVAYESEAYAVETSSASVKEELKRKIRIAAGGYQSMFRLPQLLNPFKFGILTFQYFSHRVCRWLVAPISLITVFFTNLFLVINEEGMIYDILFVLQLLFYLAALLGYIFEKKAIKIKAFFAPYYFCVMNYAVIRGAIRYFFGKQSVVWEKAKRAK